MHGLFSIPLQLFMTLVPPPDPARLTLLERGLDRLARDYDLSDREARTLKDSLVEPFRQEGLPIGPDTVQWLQLLNRRLLALPPGVLSAGAELQWTTLNLSRYATGLTFQQYLDGIKNDAPPASAAQRPAETEAAPPAAPPAEKKSKRPAAAKRRRKKA